MPLWPNRPPGQASHAASPAVAWYLPSAQASHDVCAVLACDWPVGQLPQWLVASVSTVLSPNLPVAHPTQVAAAVPVWYLPSGQVAQWALDVFTGVVESPNVPAAQPLQLL